eukprot:COSAG05_NODE_12580_length_462_cov_1.206612_1_plen_28_part_01
MRDKIIYATKTAALSQFICRAAIVMWVT